MDKRCDALAVAYIESFGLYSSIVDDDSAVRQNSIDIKQD
jgi:hypothetical protein